MKHEKEWYTCDRCGKEIKNICGLVTHKMKISKNEYEIIQKEESGYITETEFESPGVLSVEIVKFYSNKSESIQLCRKCRKAFERFMKGENK